MLSNICLCLHAAAWYVLLLLVLVGKFHLRSFELYVVTHSYSSLPFLCTLGRVHSLVWILHWAKLHVSI